MLFALSFLLSSLTPVQDLGDVQALSHIGLDHSIPSEPDPINAGAGDPPTPPAEQKGDAKAEKPPTPPHTGVHALLDGLRLDIANLPSQPNLFLAMAGGSVAAAVHPFDQTFNVRLRSHEAVVNTVFGPAKFVGNAPEQLGASLGAYAIGRLFDEPKLSHLGMDLLRAQVISELLVQPLKFATHRQRPDGSNFQSFPSGHAAATFAAATVIERHLGWKKAVLGYGIAAYVSASRLHDNVHYLSDVAFGSAVGTIAGRTVTEHGRETWTLAPTYVPGGGGILLMHVSGHPTPPPQAPAADPPTVSRRLGRHGPGSRD